jgi:hypothetical protein
MIRFTSKSDCGKYSLVFQIEEVAAQAAKPSPKPTQLPVPVTPVEENWDMKPEKPEERSIPVDPTAYVVPPEYDKRVRKMWTEGVPWEPYNISHEAAQFKKRNGGDLITVKQAVELQEMRQTNKLIDKLKREKVEYLIRQDNAKLAKAENESVVDAERRLRSEEKRTPLSTQQKLDRIRQEEARKERDVIAKEGVTLKRLRNAAQQSV